MNEWYRILNADEVDSPALAIYPDRIRENIDLAIRIAGGTDRLRPHVKTNKMAEVCTMLLRSGITKFKCATIAEAEMLGMIKAPDVLLAYQPVGPKIRRFVSLVESYPDTRFSCLTDNSAIARDIDRVCFENKIRVDVYIDLNVGMNRTGAQAGDVPLLAEVIAGLPNLRLKGIHAYDGHIHDKDLEARRAAGEQSFAIAEQVLRRLKTVTADPLHIIMGGTPTFPVHVGRPDTEYSPGTFVFWDWGYSEMLPDLSFRFAALVLTRVISVIDGTHVCMDLGHKSVAAENPLPRVYFLNAPEAIPGGQSEEHLVVEVKDSSTYPVGTLFYGVPVHICPTVALYDTACVIKDHKYTDRWKVVARDRSINI